MLNKMFAIEIWTRY